MEEKVITVETIVNAPVKKVWEFWTKPEHITKWNFASGEWQSPAAENDLRKDGKFLYRMEAKDGTVGFNFEGKYTEVLPNEKISYVLGDGRKVDLIFQQEDDNTHITEKFEPESEHSAEMQKTGWQAILNNFKSYVENKGD